MVHGPTWAQISSSLGRLGGESTGLYNDHVDAQRTRGLLNGVLSFTQWSKSGKM
jgi:hypothetical protein